MMLQQHLRMDVGPTFELSQGVTMLADMSTVECRKVVGTSRGLDANFGLHCSL